MRCNELQLRTLTGILALASFVVLMNASSPALAQCDPQEVANLFASDPGVGDLLGYSVSVFGDTVVAGAVDDDPAGLNNGGSAYVFVRNGGVWSPQGPALNASDAAEGDQFGQSVAISGDTIVLGAFGDDDAGGSSGSAYVFVRSGGVWTEQAKLTASDAAAGDQFGWSVALSGDTAVVGAWQDDLVGLGFNAGSAYVFVRSGTAWSEQAKLTAADAADQDAFGISVAASGDTLVVGAYGNDDAGDYTGSAYVFVRSGAVWSQQAKLTASDGATYADFGLSVALLGDTALIGANEDDHVGATDAGSAYVYSRSGSVWTEQAKLTATDAAALDHFGVSVALSDGAAVVGARYDDHAGGENAGSAYVFVRSGSVWMQHAKLTASDAAANNRFGYSVALFDETAVIAAPYSTPIFVTESGSAYVFDLNCTPDPQRADANCDGTVDFFDIDPFLLALFCESCYQAQFCGGEMQTVDADCDGNSDFFDIDPFLACLFSGCGPCP